MDEFSYHYTVSEKPHIQNDIITSEYTLCTLSAPLNCNPNSR